MIDIIKITSEILNIIAKRIENGEKTDSYLCEEFFNISKSIVLDVENKINNKIDFYDSSYDEYNNLDILFSAISVTNAFNVARISEVEIEEELINSYFFLCNLIKNG